LVCVASRESFFGQRKTEALGLVGTLSQSTTATTTVLVANPMVVSSGRPVILTATVTPSNATGHVTFLEGTTSLGVSPVVNGVATLTITLPIGVHSIHAHYHNA
jgi:hypothetical protein